MWQAFVVLALSTAVAAAAAANERIAGPVAAEALRVIDGDTLEVRARVWLGQAITVSARIRGIDAPELHGHCPEEKEMARRATARLAAATQSPLLSLTNIENDKYAGRVIADIVTADGTALAAVMLGSGLVRAYDGGKRGAWCDGTFVAR